MKYTKLIALIFVLAAAGGALWHGQQRRALSPTQPLAPITETTPTTTNDTLAAETPTDIGRGTPRAPIASDSETQGDARPTAREQTCAPSIRLVIAQATYVSCANSEVSVIDLMRSLQSEGLTFTGREHPAMGYFIESINGVTPEGSKYWFLYVNGVSASTGASQTRVSPGDTIEWRYQDRY